MATFQVKNIRKMTPRPGVTFSTEYYQQTQRDYDATAQWLITKIESIVQAAEKANDMKVLEQPLKGFKKTTSKDNYTAMEIMMDLLQQYKLGRDWPSGMVGRWNRLFDEYPHWQLEFTLTPEKNNYTALFA